MLSVSDEDFDDVRLIKDVEESSKIMQPILAVEISEEINKKVAIYIAKINERTLISSCKLLDKKRVAEIRKKGLKN